MSQQTDDVRALHAQAVAACEAAQLPYQRIFNDSQTLAIHVVKESDAELAARSEAAAAQFAAVFGRPMREDDPALWDADFTDEPRPTPERERFDAQCVALGNAALRSGDASLAVQTLTVRSCNGVILTPENLGDYTVEEVDSWFQVKEAIEAETGGSLDTLRFVTEYVYVADVLKAGIHRYAKLPTDERESILRASYRQVVNDFGTQGTIYAQNVIYTWLYMFQMGAGVDYPDVLTRAMERGSGMYGSETVTRIEETWASISPSGEFTSEPPRGGRDVLNGMKLVASLIIELDPEQVAPLEIALNTGDFLAAAFTLVKASL